MIKGDTLGVHQARSSPSAAAPGHSSRSQAAGMSAAWQWLVGYQSRQCWCRGRARWRSEPHSWRASPSCACETAPLFSPRAVRKRVSNYTMVNHEMVEFTTILFDKKKKSQFSSGTGKNNFGYNCVLYKFLNCKVLSLKTVIIVFLQCAICRRIFMDIWSMCKRVIPPLS